MTDERQKTTQPDSGTTPAPPAAPADFEQLDDESMSLVREFLVFLGENKKYWLLPIILVLLALGLLIILGGSSAAPFIYTLF